MNEIGTIRDDIYNKLIGNSYISDFSSGTDGWTSSTATLEGGQSIGGQDDVLKVTHTTGSFELITHPKFFIPGNIDIALQIYIPSTNATSNPVFSITSDLSPLNFGGSGGVVDSWVDFDFVLPTAGVVSGSSVEITVDLEPGDVYYLRAVTASSTGGSFSASNTEKGRYAGQNIPKADLPKAVIYFEGTESEYMSIGATRTIEFDSTWRVDVFTTSESNADSLVEEIVNALNDRTLGGDTQDLTIAGLTYEFSTEGDADYIRASLQLNTNHKITKGD